MRTVFAALVTLVLLAAPALAQHHHDAPAADGVPLFDNLGRHHHAITTRVPEAQRYFDQGLRLVYAFNHAIAQVGSRRAASRKARIASSWLNA